MNDEKQLAIELGASSRLDIAWINTRKKLRLMVGPLKNSSAAGEGILPDTWIKYGRRLYGPDEAEKHFDYYQNIGHNSWHFIAHTLVFVAFCEDYILSERQKYKSTLKQNTQ